MKKLLPSLFLLICFYCNSQTLILTKAAYEPIVGDSGRVYVVDTSAYASGLNVALTGSNAVWNYTNLVATSNSATSAYLAPAAVPSASNYAGCTVVQKQGTLYSYYKSVSNPSTQLEFIGVSSTSLNMNFSNTAVYAKYPFTIGNSFTDSFSGSFSFSTTTGTSSGNATVTADGTGTLNLPDATWTDVLRVKSYQSTSFFISGIPAGSVKQTVYNFYHSSQKFPLLTIDYSTISLALQSPTVSAQVTGNTNNFTVGMKENTWDDITTKLYPNPANEVLNIFIEVPFDVKEIIIYNQLGQKVYNNIFENQINIAALNQGVYFIEIKAAKGVSRKKFIKE